MSVGNKNDVVLKTINRILNSKNSDSPKNNLLKATKEKKNSPCTSEDSLRGVSKLDESFETFPVAPVSVQSMNTTENTERDQRGREQYNKTVLNNKNKDLMGNTGSIVIGDESKKPNCTDKGDKNTTMSVELLKHASPVLLRTSASSNNLFYNSDSDLCSIITNKNKNTNDVVKANGEIKEKNNKFLDELFTRSMLSLNKIYKEHTSCLSYMAFDNAMSDKLEEFYSTNTDSKNFPTAKFNPEASYKPNKIKRIPKLKSSIKARDLDKMSRLSNLIEIYNYSELEDLVRTQKPKRHMFCNSLQYQASSRASTTSSNCSISNNNVTQSPTKSNGVNSKHVVHQETIEEEEEEEESNDIVVVEDGTIESVTDDNNEQMDCYSVKSSQCEDEIEETIIQHPLPLPAHENFSELIPIVATLTLKTSCGELEEGERRSVALTWDLKKSDNAFLSKHTRYNDVPLEEYHKLIKEYEIFGYKETTGERNCDWQMIGVIENFVPPVRCTLTDFYKDSTYHFAIRIRDNSDYYSDYSAPVSAVFKD